MSSHPGTPFTPLRSILLPLLLLPWCGTGCSSDGDDRPPPGAADAGMPVGPVGPVGPAGQMPRTCSSEAMCTGACPPGSLGCTCRDPGGGAVCIPTCSAAVPCPPGPSGELQCQDGVCVPPRPPGGVDAGS
jgi:hypothetical protein